MSDRIISTADAVEPLWKRADIQRIFGISARTLCRLVASGEIPPPLKVGCRERWRASDFSALLNPGQESVKGGQANEQ